MSFDVFFFSIITFFLCIYSFVFHQITWNSWVHSISLPGGDENVLAKGRELRSISSPTQKRLKIVSFCGKNSSFCTLWLDKVNVSYLFWNFPHQKPSLTSAPPYLHQRPPSVGMPRHALRRRIPRYTWSAVAARCRCFFTQRGKLRGWGGSLTRSRDFGFFNLYVPIKNFGISKTSRTIWLKFGTRTPLGTVKMIPYWRFAR